VDVDGNAGLNLGQQGFTLAKSDATNRDVGLSWVLESLEGVALESALAVVPGDYTESTLGGCKLHLDAEGADTAVDEGDLALQALGEVRLFASQVGNRDKRARNIALRCQSGREDFDSLVVCRKIGRHTDQERNTLKLDSVVVRELLQSLLDPGDCVVVALAANDTVPARRAVGNLLQVLGLCVQVVDIKKMSQCLLGDC
jgi:hypothetical protein